MNSYVYFIKDDADHPKFKIGKSNAPEQRLADLQVGTAHHLTLIGTVECESSGHANAFEKQLHCAFHNFKCRGEWFYYSGEAALKVAALLRPSYKPKIELRSRTRRRKRLIALGRKDSAYRLALAEMPGRNTITARAITNGMP